VVGFEMTIASCMLLSMSRLEKAAKFCFKTVCTRAKLAGKGLQSNNRDMLLRVAVVEFKYTTEHCWKRHPPPS
jgi:hypothetical protein